MMMIIIIIIIASYSCSAENSPYCLKVYADKIIIIIIIIITIIIYPVIRVNNIHENVMLCIDITT